MKLKCVVLQIITIICITLVQKNFWIRHSIKQLLTRYQIFTKLPIFQVHLHFFQTNCFIPINFMAGTCLEYSFPFFFSFFFLPIVSSLYYLSHYNTTIWLWIIGDFPGHGKQNQPLCYLILQKLNITSTMFWTPLSNPWLPLIHLVKHRQLKFLGLRMTKEESARRYGRRYIPTNYQKQTWSTTYFIPHLCTKIA